MLMSVTRYIEARNLTRNKGIIIKTFLKCTCSNCDYTPSNLTHLNKHKKGKHDEVKFKCDHCGM